MNDPKDDAGGRANSGSERESSRAGDEKPASKKQGKGAPIGTHSLTGGGANVGIPSSSPDAPENVEHSDARGTHAGDAQDPDSPAEPRAGADEATGRKPRSR